MSNLNKDSLSKVYRGKFSKAIIYIGLIIILALLPIFIKSPYSMHIIILVFVYIIVSVSFRTIAISGQFPLGHAAFMGIGAYTAACLARWLGWSPWFTIPIGALVAMGMGILIGYPFARLRSLYYALVSLFFGIAVVNAIPAFGVWTGGYGGLTAIPPLFGTNKVPYYYFFLALVSLSLFAMYRFEYCRLGITLKAIAQSHLVAQSVGINEARYKVLALAVGCFFVGLAGACYAHYNLVLSTASFNFSATLWIVLYTVIGGLGSFAGPIIGTTILMLIPEVFRSLQEYTPYIGAVLLLVVAFYTPDGLVGIFELIKTYYSKNIKSRGIARAA